MISLLFGGTLGCVDVGQDSCCATRCSFIFRALSATHAGHVLKSLPSTPLSSTPMMEHGGSAGSRSTSLVGWRTKGLVVVPVAGAHPQEQHEISCQLVPFVSFKPVIEIGDDWCDQSMPKVGFPHVYFRRFFL